jgi:hypothetical protein
MIEVCAGDILEDVFTPVVTLTSTSVLPIDRWWRDIPLPIDE